MICQSPCTAFDCGGQTGEARPGFNLFSVGSMNSLRLACPTRKSILLPKLVPDRFVILTNEWTICRLGSAS